jgi:hypothetical protein
MNRVIVPQDKYDALKDEIAAFLKECGIGTSRFGGRVGSINHWLGPDDWCYYDQWETMLDPDLNQIVNVVFLFRSEKNAVEFALRFA